MDTKKQNEALQLEVREIVQDALQMKRDFLKLKDVPYLRTCLRNIREKIEDAIPRCEAAFTEPERQGFVEYEELEQVLTARTASPAEDRSQYPVPVTVRMFKVGDAKRLASQLAKTRGMSEPPSRKDDPQFHADLSAIYEHMAALRGHSIMYDAVLRGDIELDVDGAELFSRLTDQGRQLALTKEEYVRVVTRRLLQQE